MICRNCEDNLEANKRFLQKKHTEPSLRECAESIKFKKLHELAHRRFYCHAQEYQVPTYFITYTGLLTYDPYKWRNLMTFLGYPNANVSKAMSENPPMKHETHGGAKYAPMAACDQINAKYRNLFANSSQCAKKVAGMLQFH
tara:strand:+ start:189 stop:614 length:426 start_codon:yes stop_codon:yes gene_type:complete